MKILRSIDMYPYRRYLVEVEPEHRLMFTSDFPDGHQTGSYYLPLPRIVYNILAPMPNMDDAALRFMHGCNVIAAYGLDAPYQPGALAYFLPFPNQYGTTHRNSLAFRFHNCSASTAVDNTLEPEAVIEQILEYFWSSDFRYFMATGRPYDICFTWIGIRSGANMQSYFRGYQRWEDLSLEQACKYPWGKVALPENVDYWFEHHAETR